MATPSLPSGQIAFLDLDLSVVFGDQAGTVTVRGSTRDETWAGPLGSLLDEGDRVICSRHGADSARPLEIAERAGPDLVSCDVPIDEGAPLSVFSQLVWSARINAVLVTQEESSAGVRNDMGRIRRPAGMARDQIATLAFGTFGGGAWDAAFIGLTPDQARLDHRDRRTENECMAAEAAREAAPPRRAVRGEPGAGQASTISWFAEASPMAMA